MMDFDLVDLAHPCAPSCCRCSDDPPLWVQPKFDGWRMLVTTWRGRLLARTRSGLNLTPNLPDGLLDTLRWVPPNSVLDGEIYRPGRSNAAIARSLADRHPELSFVAFASPVWAGVDNRQAGICEALALARAAGVDIIETKRYGGEPEEAMLRRLADDRRIHGRHIEGYVLKARHYSGWLKIKPRETADAIVLRVHSRPGGEVARSIEVRDLADPGAAPTRVGSGLSLAEREVLGGLRDRLIGAVVEIAHSGRTSRGCLLNPKFVRFRSDKPANAAKGGGA